MSLNFDEAFSFLLKHEGGFSDDQDDPGGATNFGISLRFLQTIRPNADKETITSLSLDDAKEIYRKYFWEYNHYDLINDKRIAIKLFDIAVNIGSRRVNRLIQQCCNNLNDNKYNLLDVDGFIGKMTLDTLNSLNDSNKILLIKCFKNSVNNYYNRIASSNVKLNKFLAGWKKRINDNVE